MRLIISSGELQETLNSCHATIHMDPVETENQTVKQLRRQTARAVAGLDSRLSIPHDFRMVQGETHTNLIFDVVVPYECPMRDEEVIKKLTGSSPGISGELLCGDTGGQRSVLGGICL